MTAQPSAKSRISARVYSRFTVASVPSTDTSWLRDAAQAGLIAGTVPTNGTAEARAQLRQHQRRGGVAGDHHQIGPVRRDQLVHHREHALDQLGLVLPAVGKERVVGGIDEARVRPRLGDLAMDGEPAEPGIEHQDGRRGCHANGLQSSRASRK